ncbi:MAG TPA: thrombospondin type 3 repeat-containing protein [Methylomicrobium sp.]|nr:thrombospondin type 3 repeat-containing protein [Methylomicrobium sp.]
MLYLIFILLIGFMPSSASAYLCDYLPDPFVDSQCSWSTSDSCYITAEEASAACESQELPRVGCTYYSSSAGGAIFATNPLATGLYITYDNGCKFAVFWVMGGEDADGDGIPDDKDPCPNNPNPNCAPDDSDGDGKKDDEDPCPNNPDPNCKDPNDPPGPGDPPEIPDEIPVGDCVFDLRSFKAWLNTDSAFPFNLLFRFIGLVTPLFDLNPEPPVFEIDWDLSSFHDKYPYIPSTINFRWDFTPYDTYAKVIRSALILSVIIFVVAYGLSSTKERP